MCNFSNYYDFIRTNYISLKSCNFILCTCIRMYVHTWRTSYSCRWKKSQAVTKRLEIPCYGLNTAVVAYLDKCTGLIFYYSKCAKIWSHLKAKSFSGLMQPRSRRPYKDQTNSARSKHKCSNNGSNAAQHNSERRLVIVCWRRFECLRF